MTPEKAAREDANNLILAYKDITPEEDMQDFDILKPHGCRLGTSGRRYSFTQVSYDAVEKCLSKIRVVIGTYPLESLRNKLTEIAVSAKDIGVPLQSAHEYLAAEIEKVLQFTNLCNEWDVLQAVRGISPVDQPVEVGLVTFRQLDPQSFHAWGQRYSSGLVNPPANAPVLKDWYEHQSVLVGQMVAVARIGAADSDHAVHEARRVTEESLDLIRYGQMNMGQPNGIIPEIGLAAVTANGYPQHSSVCIRFDGYGTTATLGGIGTVGAVIEHCSMTPAWRELNALLRIPATSRSEIQRRMIVGLSWIGQAALAASNSVRIVSLVTALESMLIGADEAKGKKRKLAHRVQGFPQMPEVSRQIVFDDVTRLYRIRSECVHCGDNEVTDADISLTNVAIAQVFSGLLKHNPFRELRSLSEVLSLMFPLGEPASDGGD